MENQLTARLSGDTSVDHEITPTHTLKLSAEQWVGFHNHAVAAVTVEQIRIAEVDRMIGAEVEVRRLRDPERMENKGDNAILTALRKALMRSEEVTPAEQTLHS